MDPLEEAYRIESALAAMLRTAPKESRASVARAVYADLYRLVRSHPDLTRGPEERRRRISEVRFAYERWIADAKSVLEIGSGSCELLAELGSDYPQKRFAGIDVARAPFQTAGVDLPSNVVFTQAGVSEIPFEDASFDFVFCSQVLEHFHPDDVPDHLSEVVRVLKNRGWLGIDTPNRLTGPHDISRGFSPEATGLHLKEWTFKELVPLLRDNGFARVRARWVPGRAARSLRLVAPGPLVNADRKAAVEQAVSRVTHVPLRRMLGRALGVDGIYLYAQKGAG